MLELVLALAMVLLLSAWFASFFDRRVRLGLVPAWRRVIAGIGLLLLTVSLIELLYCYQRTRGGSFGLILSLAESGLVLAAVACLTCGFASAKRSRFCYRRHYSLLVHGFCCCHAWFECNDEC